MFSRKSFNQLIYFLSNFRHSIDLGFDIKEARNRATSKTASKYVVTTNTIEDLLRRRLGFDNISQFDYLLDKWIQGNHSELNTRIFKYVGTSERIIINNFFLGNNKSISTDISSKKEKFTQYVVNIHDDYILKTVSSEDDLSPSDWIERTISEILDERKYKIISELLNNLSDMERQKFLREYYL